MRTFKTTSEAYLSILDEVLSHPDFMVSPRGKPIYEILDFQYKILEPSSDPIVTKDPERNKVIVDYTAKELTWYKSGDITVESAEKISKFWGTLANADGTVNSNYGHLIFNDRSEGNPLETVGTEWSERSFRSPYDWALQSLKNDADSRQALVRINKPKHLFVGNRDVVCTLHMIFHIRADKLFVSIAQRSCDMKTGFVFDIPYFAYVQQKMLADLLPTYPNLQLGALTHTINSCHIYQKDIEAVKKMLGQ
jgi:thymidylate synthase